MSKVTFKPGTMVNPVPVVMVSCGDMAGEHNIITIAWTGIVNSEPPMTYISVRKSRHSHSLIEKSGEFVINLTTEKLAFQTDYCGVKSGRDVNKFEEQKLTPVPGEHVKSPMIKEAPVNLECRVREVHHYPSHDMFVADILAVHADDSLFHENGKLELERAGLLCYSHGEYFGLQKHPLGKFGYSIMKPKTKKRIEAEARKKKQTGLDSQTKPKSQKDTEQKAGTPKPFYQHAAGQKTGSAGAKTGSAGPKAGSAGQKSGSAGPKAGSAGQKSRFAGQKTGSAGPKTGSAGQKAGSREKTGSNLKDKS